MNPLSDNTIEKSEQRFRNVLLQAPAIFLILEGDEMKITFANQALLNSLNKTEEIIGKTLLQVLPEIKDQPFPKLLQHVYETGEVYYGKEEKAAIIKNGKSEDVFYNYIYQPIYEADKTISGITIMATDITEHVIDRKKIEASENQIRFMAESMPQKIFTALPNGDVDYFNPQWSEFTGLTFEQIKNWGWLQFIHPDDKEENIRKWQHSIDTGEPFRFEHRFRFKDGVYRWHLSRASAMRDEKGTIIKWFGSNTDIHEQKTNAEEKFLLEFAEDFSHYKTGDEFFGSLVTYIANKTNLDYVFIGELTEKENNYFIIKTIALANRGTLVPNIEYPLPDGPCEQVMRGTVYNYPNQCRITFPKNQTLVQFNVEGYVGYPLFDSDGRAIGLVAVMHEKEILNPEYVSALLKLVAKRAEFEMERHTTEIKLQTKNTELERSNTELASFNYIANHDLQEPLRKIQTFTQLILDTEKFSGKTHEYFKSIIESSSRMRNLLTSLLNFSRIDAIELIFEPCNLNTIVEESKSDLHLSIVEKQAIIEHENLPTINGVYIQISQLITNLLDNAIKYSRPEIKPHIKITSSIIDGKIIEHPSANNQKEYHAIKIADNGIGFEKKYENKIFELFQRLHHKNEYSGTGIGLGIVKKIVTNHNGFIIAEGKPYIGSTFTIYIPTS